MSAPATADTLATTTKNPILWGAYLACSWTWCIGMFLPALLMRDLGWGGFLVFAIPNILGAAAMGWVLRSRVDSSRMVENHPRAIWWFSLVTLAFHVFWIIWITGFIRSAFPIPDPYLAGVGAVVIAFSIVSGRAVRMGRSPQLAIVLLSLSVAVLIATLLTPNSADATEALFESAPESRGVLWMLPITIFGFVLCPYLDITFHHARQQLDTKRNGRIGFTIGFVVFFAMMIILTTRYAGVMIGALDKTSFVPIAAPWLAAAIMTHILCQWVFTVRVHLDRMRTIPGRQSDQRVVFAIALIAGLIGLYAIKLPAHSGLAGGEIVYRAFMGAYGLVFPSYMLYRVVLARQSGTRISVALMWTAIVLAMPMFWMGFMERETIWLAPGLGIVLIGAVLLLSKGSKSHDRRLASERVG